MTEPATAVRAKPGLAPATKANVFGTTGGVEVSSDQPYPVIGEPRVAPTGVTKVNQPE